MITPALYLILKQLRIYSIPSRRRISVSTKRKKKLSKTEVVQKERKIVELSMQEEQKGKKLFSRETRKRKKRS